MCAEQADWRGLFPLGMAALRGQDTSDLLGALHMQMSRSQFQQFTRDGLAEAADLSPRMPGG